MGAEGQKDLYEKSGIERHGVNLQDVAAEGVCCHEGSAFPDNTFTMQLSTTVRFPVGFNTKVFLVLWCFPIQTDDFPMRICIE